LTIEALAARVDDLEQAHSRKVADLEQANATLREEMAQQHARSTELQEEIARMHAVPAAGQEAEAEQTGLILPASISRRSGGQDDQPTRRSSRRKLLQLGGAAAAAGVAAVVAADRGAAHAASAGLGDGTSLTIGQLNSGSNSTLLFPQSPAAPNPLLSVDNSNGGGDAISGSGKVGFSGVSGFMIGGLGNGVYGQATTTGVGVQGQSLDTTSGTSGVGVLGTAKAGVGVNAHSDSNNGVFATSGSWDGLFAGGGRYGAALQGAVAPLLILGSSVPGAPTTGKHFKGEIYMDGNATLWVCVVGDGTGVGVWLRLTGVFNGSTGGAMYFLPGIVRVVGAGNPPGVQINTGSPQTFPIAGQGGIPSFASAVFGNATVYGSSATGFISVFPAGGSSTGGSLNFTAGDEPLSNFVATALGTSGKITVATFGAGCKFIYDAVGYTV
jgi:hypothetical protein